MTITDPEESEGLYEKMAEPEISLEWKDLKIEIKYCGHDIPDEVQDFVELFPNLSDKLVSSEYIQVKRQEHRRRQKEAEEDRPGSRSAAAHTLSQVLEQNQVVNNKRRSDGSSASGVFSPEPTEAEGDAEIVEEEDSKSQKSEDFELPDNIDQLIDVKLLIKLEDGSTKCHICHKIFTDGTRMKRHLLSHSENKPYKCNLCGWGFHQKTNMERHLASHTNEGEGYPCSYCNSWFTTKSVVSLHIREAHSGKSVPRVNKYEEDDTDYSPGVSDSKKAKPTDSDTVADDLSQLKCNICGKTFVKKTNLKHHLMLHRGEKPWKCHICSWRFVQKCNLKKHIETHTTGTYKCPQCDIRFASKGAVNSHLESVHNKPRTHHVLNHSDNKLGIGFKQEAGIILNTNVLVQPEEEEEEAEIPAPPDDDDKSKSSNSTPSSHWWHSIEDTPAPAPEPVQQIVAGAITITTKPLPSSSSGTKLQQILNSGFPCKSCPKTFTSRKELDNHVLVHSAGMKPFACPVCGLRFHLLHNMKRHLLTHEESGDIEAGTADGLLEAVEAAASRPPPSSPGTSGSDPAVTTTAAGHMKCNLCNKWFSEQIALQRHMDVHSKNRPYACPVCGWRFKQVHNMKRHLLTHSGAKPFSCDFCDKSYTDNYSLKQHVAKVHPDIANSLPPHMLITPRNKARTSFNSKEVDDEGFKSMVNEMTASQKAAALKAYQDSLKSHDDLPFGVEAVTYDEDDEDDGVDPTEFMETSTLEIDESEGKGETVELSTDHIEIEQPPVTQEVIDEGGEADDEVDTETENDIGQS